MVVVMREAALIGVVATIGEKEEVVEKELKGLVMGDESR